MFGAKETICICPKCEKIHSLRIYWTGNGVPKLYCPACRSTVDNIGKFNIGGHNQSFRRSYPILQP